MYQDIKKLPAGLTRTVSTTTDEQQYAIIYLTKSPNVEAVCNLSKLHSLWSHVQQA